MRNDYEEWLKEQPIYKTLVFQYGDKVLIHECGAYKHLAVELGYQAWCQTKLKFAYLFNEHQETLLDLAYFKRKSGVVSCNQDN